MFKDLFSLKGRVALVTGGSRGIGKMIAAGFLAQGAAKVYITARKAGPCEATAKELTAAYDAPVPAGERASLDAAVKRAQAALPGMTLQFVAFPGSNYSTDHHYAVFFHGDTPLTTHMITPALIDARTGDLAAVAPMPWYVKTLSLSQPLHFGDYGGLGLKILWALLDLAAIVILISGLYLWLAKRKKPA